MGEFNLDEAIIETEIYQQAYAEHLNGKAHDAVHAPPAFHHTDLGNAERLIHQHDEQIRYCHIWKKWIVYDGKRWELDTTQRVKRLAQNTIRAIYTEAASIEDTKERKALVQHAMRSEADTRINAMLNHAQVLCPITPDDLDTDPWLLNLDNGTLNLKTCELLPHKPSDFITKLAPVAYDPTASCPTWLAFLDRIMAGNADLIGYLEKAAGYSLTGETGEECLFFLHGPGRNGKTKFLEALGFVLGDYGQPTEFSTLLHKDHDTVRNDVADLKSARFVTAVEVNEGRRLNESLIKNMSGGDRIRARFLFSEHFTFMPAFKLWLASNHKPVIRGTDLAIWERIKLIPFMVTIPEAERDKQLLDKLKVEASGILLWALEGCYRWQKEGLTTPAAIREATADYRKQMDVLGAFIEECCIIHETAQVAVGELFSAYTAWCKGSGEDAVSKKTFGLKLEERGFTPGRTSFGRLWKGIRLFSDSAEGETL